MDSGSRECNTLNFDIKCFGRVFCIVAFSFNFKTLLVALLQYSGYLAPLQYFWQCQNSFILIVNGAQVDTIRSSSVVYGRIAGFLGRSTQNCRYFSPLGLAFLLIKNCSRAPHFVFYSVQFTCAVFFFLASKRLLICIILHILQYTCAVICMHAPHSVQFAKIIQLAFDFIVRSSATRCSKSILFTNKTIYLFIIKNKNKNCILMIFHSVLLLCNCRCIKTHILSTLGSETANAHGQTIASHVMRCELPGYCNCFSILCANLDYIPHKPNLRSGQHSICSRMPSK